jgi:disulfide bond formation protein DsbB
MVYTEFLATGVFLLDLALVSLPLVYWARKKGYMQEKFDKLDEFLAQRWKQICILMAFFATTGSLYLSNQFTVLSYTIGKGLSPCHLCWFQRIFMYPLILLFGVSIYLRETVSEYAIPLATVGGGIAGYHYIIQRFDQFSSAGCSVTAVSCETTQIPFYYGYISIPIMAFTGFAVILLLSWRYGEL